MQIFKTPDTSVDERLDEIVTMARDWEPIEYAWPALKDIDWLRGALNQNWRPGYPQPYIGVGPDDGMMSLYWKAVAATVTLEIDTVTKIGELYRAPSQAVGEVEIGLDMDLTGENTWLQIASALGVKVARDGNLLAPSVERPVPGRGNTGGRVPSKNKPGTAGLIRGRSWAGGRPGAGRITRYSRGISFKSRMVSTRRRHRLHRNRVGSVRRHFGVRARTA